MEWIRSSWPRVDLPPELSEQTDEGNTFFTINFENPNQFDAPRFNGLSRTFVILRRVTGRKESDPQAGINDLPTSGDINNTIRWEVVGVQDQVARNCDRIASRWQRRIGRNI